MFGLRPVYVYPKKTETEGNVLSGRILETDIVEILKKHTDIRG